jgi:hypothetical protein
MIKTTDNKETEKDLKEDYNLSDQDAREIALIINKVIDYSEKGRYYKNRKELCQMCIEDSPAIIENTKRVVSLKTRDSVTADEIQKSSELEKLLERIKNPFYLKHKDAAKKLNFVWVSKMETTRTKKISKAEYVAIVDGAERHLCGYHLDKIGDAKKIDNDQIWYVGE